LDPQLSILPPNLGSLLRLLFTLPLLGLPLCPLVLERGGQDLGVPEDIAHLLCRLRAHRQPVLDALDVESDQLLAVPVGQGIVRPNCEDVLSCSGWSRLDFKVAGPRHARGPLKQRAGRVMHMLYPGVLRNKTLGTERWRARGRHRSETEKGRGGVGRSRYSKHLPSRFDRASAATMR